MLDEELPENQVESSAEETNEEAAEEKAEVAVRPPATMLLFQAPETELLPARKPAKPAEQPADEEPAEEPTDNDEDTEDSEESAEGDGDGGNRRRRRRGGRRRGRKDEDDVDADDEGSSDSQGDGDDGDSADDGGSGDSRRRRRRRRPGEEEEGSPDDPENTVTRTRKQRNPEDEIASVSGSTRLEAKKQRRREGREAGRRRAPIVSEAEFLARREAVDRVMVIRQREDLTQIAVLEDKVLVEHYVARKSQTSLIGNVYLGKVQNVLPSMEAAFIDIGKGRNAVLYAGEVNWAALGHPEGEPRKIESVLTPGQAVLVQVSKDPVGAKGARLTSQISLPGRFLVYVPSGNTSGISRKLPDTERTRLKNILKTVVPDAAGVIVRTAAEGASEEDLTRDVERLAARWEDIEKKVKEGKAPELLYGEPDLTLKVVRDLFTEDFAKLVVQGDDAWDLVDGYVSHVAPDLRDRLSRHEPGEGTKDLFAEYRVDEQIAKGLDRKVWLPSGGSLIIDRTEAMTVVDVNTGKFTGSGGNLEETVTKNNLEAAEEIVRQLRLRDIGGIIVVDFIDMVLESNRELVLRRLVECLGRDRTRHQVAEVTSLGLVQMTRKRIGTGLLEAFSEDCDHCKGRGVVLHDHPVEKHSSGSGEQRQRRNRGGRGRSNGGGGNNKAEEQAKSPSPADLAGSKPPTADESEELASESRSGDSKSSQNKADEKKADEKKTSESKGTETPVASPEPDIAAAQETPETPPTEVPSAESQAEAAPSAAPVVATTTRRRRAARPAGPPAAEQEPAAEVVPEPAEEPEETNAGGASEGLLAGLLHVPIKRKGGKKK
jgi:ribonuclease E